MDAVPTAAFAATHHPHTCIAHARTARALHRGGRFMYGRPLPVASSHTSHYGHLMLALLAAGPCSAPGLVHLREACLEAASPSKGPWQVMQAERLPRGFGKARRPIGDNNGRHTKHVWKDALIAVIVWSNNNGQCAVVLACTPPWRAVLSHPTPILPAFIIIILTSNPFGHSLIVWPNRLIALSLPPPHSHPHPHRPSPGRLLSSLDEQSNNNHLSTTTPPPFLHPPLLLLTP